MDRRREVKFLSALSLFRIGSTRPRESESYPGEQTVGSTRDQPFVHRLDVFSHSLSAKIIHAYSHGPLGNLFVQKSGASPDGQGRYFCEMRALLDDQNSILGTDIAKNGILGANSAQLSVTFELEGDLVVRYNFLGKQPERIGSALTFLLIQ